MCGGGAMRVGRFLRRGLPRHPSGAPREVHSTCLHLCVPHGGTWESASRDITRCFCADQRALMAVVGSGRVGAPRPPLPPGAQS